jgi:hypothetical protein
MSEDISIEWQQFRLNERITELSRILPQDAATVFEDESRLFLKQVIRFTPPKTKAQGEAAITRDLGQLFTAVDENMLNTIGSEHGLSAIDVWLTTANGERKELDWRKIDPTGAGMKEFHYRNRDSRGRAFHLKRQRGQKWYAPYVVSFEDMAAYRDKMKARVGRRKAAWAKSYVALKGTVAAWIGRHIGGAKGEFHISTNPSRPAIVMINRAAGIGQDTHIVSSALRARYQAIGKRMRLIASGYSKDVAQGIRLANHAIKSPESFQEAA